MKIYNTGAGLDWIDFAMDFTMSKVAKKYITYGWE